MFIFIVSVAAIFIAGCAAFFSIKGLMVLFAGSAFAVAIMASSLELGKLVAASFLHRNWKTSSFFLKTYLTLAVGVLMFITSLGIFGFLTNAYQLHKGTADGIQAEQAAIEKQQAILSAEIEANTARIDSLITIRKEQEGRVNAAGNYKAPREQAYQAIAAANEELKAKELRQIELRDKLTSTELKKTEISRELSTKTDIGSFKFIADSLGVDIDTAVRYFILSLVLVFDPLAISLVLALNQLIELRELKKRNKASSPTLTELRETSNASAISETPLGAAVATSSEIGEEEASVETEEEVLKKQQRKLIPENNSIVRKT
jgi:hypothetical protein